MNYKIEDFNLTIDTWFEIFDKLEKSGVKKTNIHWPKPPRNENSYKYPQRICFHLTQKHTKLTQTTLW